MKGFLCCSDQPQLNFCLKKGVIKFHFLQKWKTQSFFDCHGKFLFFCFFMKVSGFGVSLKQQNMF